MSGYHDGSGAAFPFIRDVDRKTGVPILNEGMTLRDYFAAKAMQAWVRDNVTMEQLADGRPDFHADWVAKAAYAMADAMLKARQA